MGEYIRREIELAADGTGYRAWTRFAKFFNLSELMNAAKKHTPEIFKAFPRDTPEEKQLFDLLQRAYIESRYNPDFEITKADIDALLPKIELLRDVVEQVCNERLAYYDSRIEK